MAPSEWLGAGLARALFYPTLLYTVLRGMLNGPGHRAWYHRIDGTVLLGALPLRSLTRKVSGTVTRDGDRGRRGRRETGKWQAGWGTGGQRRGSGTSCLDGDTGVGGWPEDRSQGEEQGPGVLASR